MSDFIDLDFTGVDRGPKLIPEGDHVLTVVGFEKKKPKTPLNANGEKKYDSIHVTFEDAEGSKVRSFFNLHQRFYLLFFFLLVFGCFKDHR